MAKGITFAASRLSVVVESRLAALPMRTPVIGLARQRGAAGLDINSGKVGVTAEANSIIEVQSGSYEALTKELKGTELQAHHANQNAAFSSIIPKDEGFSVALRGNAFTEAGSPHFEVHNSMESFWDSYRKGGDLFGEVPTNAQYGDAVTQSFRAGGLSEVEAKRLSDLAKQNRDAFGLKPTDPIPRIPRKIYQSGRQ